MGFWYRNVKAGHESCPTGDGNVVSVPPYGRVEVITSTAKLQRLIKRKVFKRCGPPRVAMPRPAKLEPKPVVRDKAEFAETLTEGKAALKVAGLPDLKKAAKKKKRKKGKDGLSENVADANEDGTLAEKKAPSK